MLKARRAKRTWSTRNPDKSSRWVKDSGRSKDSATRVKKKPSEKGHGLCICGGDHYCRDCPNNKTPKSKDNKKPSEKQPDKKDKKKRSYASKTIPEDTSDESKTEQEDDSDSDYSEDGKRLSNFTVIKRSLLSFAHSTTTDPHPLDVVELPKAPSVGAGLWWLNGDPLPVEIWLLTSDPTSPRRSITGCANSGGQSLIRKSILLDHILNAEILAHCNVRPSFQGIGGATERPLGHITLPVLMPDALGLAGKPGGRAARLWLEFQVVNELDCNFLIGRDAMRAYGLDIVESKGFIAVGGVKVPIADHGEEKRIAKQMNKAACSGIKLMVKPRDSAIIPLELSRSVPTDKDLLFQPNNVFNLERELRGMMPSMIIRNVAPQVRFDNVCDYPICVQKGQILGTVSVIKTGSRMTLFASPDILQTPMTTCEPQGNNLMDLNRTTPYPLLPTIMNPWKESREVSPLDKLWFDLVEGKSVETADQRSTPTVRPNPVGKKRQREGWNLHSDRNVLMYTDTWQGRKIREDLSLRTGLQLEASKPSRRQRRIPHQSSSKARRNLQMRPVGEVTDPDKMEVEALGLDQEAEADERVVDRVLLEIDEEFRPAPGMTALWFAIDKKLSSIMREQLLSVLKKFASCFSFNGKRLGDIRMPPMSIEVVKAPSSKSHTYRESPRTAKNIRDSVAMLRELDIIEPSTAPIASPVVMIKQNGKWRFCVDFQAVNKQTVLDKYPIPRPDAVFAALAGAQFFSTMDANKGYHQFRLSEESRWLTSFITEREGIWQYKRVPFGLQNAPAFFQRLIDTLLGKHRWQFALAYIDNVVIWSKTWREHLSHISKILSSFSKVGLTLDERKCNWGFTAIDLLGLRVNRLGLRTLSAKTEAVRALPFPKTVKQLRQILGQFSYYRQFMRGFAVIAEPLTTALKFRDNSKAENPNLPVNSKLAARIAGCRLVERTPEREAALEGLKKLLTEAPVLRYPDFARPFFLYTNASGKGLGGALHQEFKDGLQHPILFISRTLAPAEKNYSATEMECLAVYWSFSKLAHYVDGCDGLTVITDHHALQWLWNIKQATNSRLHRWAMLLAPFKSKIKVVHRPGLAHSNVDPLSRFPVNSKSHFSEISSVSPPSWENAGKEYESNEYFCGHYRDAAVTTLGSTTPQVVSLSVAAKVQLGRLSSQTEGGPAPLIQNSPTSSVTAFEQLGRSKSGGNPELPTLSVAVDEQLGRSTRGNSGEISVTDGQQSSKEPEFIKDASGILWRKTDSSVILCIPFAKRLEILQVVHDELVHPGSARAFQHAKGRFFWPGMRKDIDIYCRLCHACQLVKTDTSKKPGKLNPISTPPPLHTLCIDFIEAMPPSRGCNSLATITDKFTKAIALISCKKSTTASEFASLFFKRIYPVWGVPEKIISDRDRRFVSAFWRTLMEKAGTKVALTTAYHPQADGQSERTNRTVEAILRLLVIESPETPWVDMLPTIELAVNSTPHYGSKFSPYELLYSKAPLTFGTLSAPQPEHSSQSLDAEELASALALQREQALEALTKSQAMQKRYFDGKHKPIVFLPGEWARLTHSGTFKRRSKLGPTLQVVKVVDMVTPGAYRIKVPEGLRMHDVVSVEHLRKYTPRGSRDSVIPSVELNTEPRRILRILGERMVEGSRELLVLYEGDNEEKEWVEESEAGDSKELLEEFRRGSMTTAPNAEENSPIETCANEPPVPLMIDGVEACSEDIPVVNGVCKSGRERRRKVFFDEE